MSNILKCLIKKLFRVECLIKSLEDNKITKKKGSKLNEVIDERNLFYQKLKRREYIELINELL